MENSKSPLELLIFIVFICKGIYEIFSTREVEFIEIVVLIIVIKSIIERDFLKMSADVNNLNRGMCN